MNKRKFTTAGYICIAVLIYICANIFPLILSNVLYFCSDSLGLPYDFFNSEKVNIVYIIISLAEMIIFGTIYIKFISRKKDMQKPQTTTKNISYAIICGFGISGISLIWLIFAQNILSKLEFFKHLIQSFGEGMYYMSQGPYIWAFVAVCIVGPVLEEIIFRGLIFNFLYKAFSNAVPAILICGILFGVWHGNFVQSVFTSVMGIILAYLYYETGDLKTAIAVHMINNMTSAFPAGMQNSHPALIVNIICIIMIIPMFIALRRLFLSGRSKSLS